MKDTENIFGFLSEDAFVEQTEKIISALKDKNIERKPLVFDDSVLIWNDLDDGVYVAQNTGVIADNGDGLTLNKNDILLKTCDSAYIYAQSYASKIIHGHDGAYSSYSYSITAEQLQELIAEIYDGGSGGGAPAEHTHSVDDIYEATTVGGSWNSNFANIVPDLADAISCNPDFVQYIKEQNENIEDFVEHYGINMRSDSTVTDSSGNNWFILTCSLTNRTIKEKVAPKSSLYDMEYGNVVKLLGEVESAEDLDKVVLNASDKDVHFVLGDTAIDNLIITDKIELFTLLTNGVEPQSPEDVDALVAKYGNKVITITIQQANEDGTPLDVDGMSISDFYNSDFLYSFMTQSLLIVSEDVVAPIMEAESEEEAMSQFKFSIDEVEAESIFKTPLLKIVADVSAAVEQAQNTANNAQNTANNAQSTANNAQSAAEQANIKAEQAINSLGANSYNMSYRRGGYQILKLGNFYTESDDVYGTGDTYISNAKYVLGAVGCDYYTGAIFKEFSQLVGDDFVYQHRAEIQERYFHQYLCALDGRVEYIYGKPENDVSSIPVREPFETFEELEAYESNETVLINTSLEVRDSDGNTLTPFETDSDSKLSAYIIGDFSDPDILTPAEVYGTYYCKTFVGMPQDDVIDPQNVEIVAYNFNNEDKNGRNLYIRFSPIVNEVSDSNTVNIRYINLDAYNIVLLENAQIISTVNQAKNTAKTAQITAESAQNAANNAQRALAERYTNAEINNLVGSIPKFSIKVVNVLPVSDISTTTVYLLAKQNPESSNLYTEYIYVNNNWEKLGEQTLDLSDYYNKQQTDSLVNEAKTLAGNAQTKANSAYDLAGTKQTAAQVQTAINSALYDYNTKSEVQTLISNAVANFLTESQIRAVVQEMIDAIPNGNEVEY